MEDKVNDTYEVMCTLTLAITADGPADALQVGAATIQAAVAAAGYERPEVAVELVRDDARRLVDQAMSGDKAAQEAVGDKVVGMMADGFKSWMTRLVDGGRALADAVVDEADRVPDQVTADRRDALWKIADMMSVGRRPPFDGLIRAVEDLIFRVDEVGRVLGIHDAECWLGAFYTMNGERLRAKEALSAIGRSVASADGSSPSELADAVRDAVAADTLGAVHAALGMEEGCSREAIHCRIIGLAARRAADIAIAKREARARRPPPPPRDPKMKTQEIRDGNHCLPGRDDEP